MRPGGDPPEDPSYRSSAMFEWDGSLTKHRTEWFCSTALSNQIKNGVAPFRLPNVEWSGYILRNWNGAVPFKLAPRPNGPLVPVPYRTVLCSAGPLANYIQRL